MTRLSESKLLPRLCLLIALVLALGLRLYNVSWDNGYLFHPDERQILVVAERLSFPWPPDTLLLTPQSPWNPRFFAYGSLPIYLLHVLSDLAGQIEPAYGTLDSSYVVGRVLSAIFDVGSVYLVYLLGRKLYGVWVGVLGAALTAVTVLHIQLSHFYAVDTLLAFFVLLTVTLSANVVQRPALRRALPLGIAMGMALATKVSAAPLMLTIALAWGFGILAARRDPSLLLGHSSTTWWWALLGASVTGLLSLATFLLFQPYALIDMVSFVIDVIHESYMARGVADIPYTRQYIGTAPYLYPLVQTVIWSTGVPLGVAGVLAAVGAVADTAVHASRKQWCRAGMLLLPLSWAGVYFGVVGSFHAKFLRYMLPILPFLCLWAAWALIGLVQRARRSGSVALASLSIATLALVLSSTALYAVAYLSIYSHRHTWVQATAWLCENLPQPSRIMVEHWDDPLPLLQGTGDLRCYRRHIVDEFPAYDRDDTVKLENLLGSLEKNDYIILSSNRLYNTIPRLPERYPLTSRYYELLMAERLGFELVHYVAEYPELLGLRLVNDTFADPDLPKPRLLSSAEQEFMSLNLGRADESFSVYDHPMPLVFAKTKKLGRSELLSLFGKAALGLPPPKPASD